MARNSPTRLFHRHCIPLAAIRCTRWYDIFVPHEIMQNLKDLIAEGRSNWFHFSIYVNACSWFLFSPQISHLLYFEPTSKILLNFWTFLYLSFPWSPFEHCRWLPYLVEIFNVVTRSSRIQPHEQSDEIFKKLERSLLYAAYLSLLWLSYNWTAEPSGIFQRQPHRKRIFPISI